MVVYIYAILRKKEPTRQEIYNFSFKMFKMRFSRFWKCLKTTRNSPEHGGIIMVELLKVFNAVELHFLKSLKVNCSDTACSSSLRPIFDK